MIRLAFVAVAAIGLLIAYGLFVLVGSGGDLPDVATQDPDTAQPIIETEVARTSVLGDTALVLGDDTRTLTLMLMNAGPDGQTLIITDPAVLTAVRDTMTIAGAQDRQTTPTDDTAIAAAFYRNDRLEWAIPCAQTPCTADITGIPPAAFDTVILDAEFFDHAEYSLFIADLPAQPALQLLDLRPMTDFPEPPRASSMDLSLPTAIRPATQPLDGQTHAAVLTALLTEILPQDALVANIDISQGAPAQVIDRDSSRPVTANGVPVTLPTHLFYTTTVSLTGVSNLTDEILSQISDQTRLQTDWEDDANSLLSGLGLPCADCFIVAPPFDVQDQALITAQIVPTYLVRYYDLREAP